MNALDSTEPPDENPTSPSLIAALREKNPDAWDRLVELYAPTVVQWCRHMRLNEQEIPDVLQEVFQAVATRLHQFRRNRESDTFRGWLRTVTRNKVIDHFRARERQTTGAGGTEGRLAWLNYRTLLKTARRMMSLKPRCSSEPLYSFRNTLKSAHGERSG